MSTPNGPRLSTLDNFERVGIFRFTRALALIAVAAVSIGLVVAAVIFVAVLLSQRTVVEGREVAAAIQAKRSTPLKPATNPPTRRCSVPWTCRRLLARN